MDDLSVDVEPASVCGLLGPNGAGKSTTFKCLLGLARATSGSVTIEGAPLQPGTFDYLAYVPEKSALYEWMTVEQHLEMARRAYRKYDAARARELLATFKLPPKKLVRRLSKGQHTALALVLAFAIRPRVLVLDEPASGLDPIFQRTVLDLIIDAAAGGAGVLFSSHQIGQVERAADRIAVLREGKLVLAGDIDTLKGDEKIVIAAFDALVPEMPELAHDPNVRRIERGGRIVRLYTDGESERIAGRVAALQPRSLDVVDLTLEDIFLGAVGEDGAAPPIGVES
ncbi:MAG: ABC transporter ATP-binding protein [Candidatus Eremiobacteraeota bacterium]|nr:ABC transporter ATP-binding protein [Candidatus Eremiobacteraeota bacterium]